MHRNRNIKIYPVTESFVDDKTERGYLNVWNQGTPEFTSRIQELMDQIPFQSLLDDHVESVMNGTAKKNKRGNYQLSFGIASGNSMKHWTQEVIEKNFGTAFPCIRTGTKAFLPVLRVFSKLAEEVGMRCADRSFLAKDAGSREEIAHVNDELGVEVCIALGSPCFAKLDTVSKIERHQDTQNGVRHLGQVLTGSQICKAVNGE